MTKMSYKEQSKHLAGQISLLKMFCTRCEGEIATDAIQIFGGRSLTKTGMGKCESATSVVVSPRNLRRLADGSPLFAAPVIEGFSRNQPFNAILVRSPSSQGLFVGLRLTLAYFRIGHRAAPRTSSVTLASGRPCVPCPTTLSSEWAGPCTAG
jgi:hypothetical protein